MSSDTLTRLHDTSFLQSTTGGSHVHLLVAIALEAAKLESARLEFVGETAEEELHDRQCRHVGDGAWDLAVIIHSCLHSIGCRI